MRVLWVFLSAASIRCLIAEHVRGYFLRVRGQHHGCIYYAQHWSTDQRSTVI